MTHIIFDMDASLNKRISSGLLIIIPCDCMMNGSVSKINRPKDKQNKIENIRPIYFCYVNLRFPTWRTTTQTSALTTASA